MSLHDKIMNIQISGNRSGLYKRGHHDACQAAADLALSYENMLDLVENDLEDTMKHCDMSEGSFKNLNDILDVIRKVRSGEYK